MGRGVSRYHSWSMPREVFLPALSDACLRNKTFRLKLVGQCKPGTLQTRPWCLDRQAWVLRASWGSTPRCCSAPFLHRVAPRALEWGHLDLLCSDSPQVPCCFHSGLEKVRGRRGPAVSSVCQPGPAGRSDELRGHEQSRCRLIPQHTSTTAASRALIVGWL